MMSGIRRIAIHVDEPNPGHYFWVLTEEGSDASQWERLESADEPYDTWLDALQAGVRALEGYAPDERIGPRIPSDDEDADPVG
jgi:hypothetical protein